MHSRLEACVPNRRAQQAGSLRAQPITKAQEPTGLCAFFRNSQNRPLLENKLNGQLQLSRVSDALAEEAVKTEQAGRGE